MLRIICIDRFSYIYLSIYLAIQTFTIKPEIYNEKSNKN